MPGEIKNIVDSLRRAMQGPASTLASGTPPSGNTFTLTLNPSTVNDPGGTFQSRIAVTLTPSTGFSDQVTVADVNNFCSGTTTQFSFNPVAVQGTTPTIVVYTINLPANCPAGYYRSTITGTGAVTGATASALLEVTVNVTTQIGCVNNSDCPPGDWCINGQCYAPIDNMLIGCGAGICGNPQKGICNTGSCRALCQAENQGPPITGPDGCCYCSSNVNDCTGPAADQACRIKTGKQCSQGKLVNGLCVCTDCTSSVNVSIPCPADLNLCADSTSNASNSVSLSVTNSGGAANVAFAVTSTATSNPCVIGPTLSSSTVGFTGSGTGSISIQAVNSCLTANCYVYLLTAIVTDPVTGNVVQTLTCPINVCVKTSCFVIEVRCVNSINCGGGCGGVGCPSTAWGQGAGCNTGCGGCHCQNGDSVTSSGLCGDCLFSVRARSINGFSGTVNVSASNCGATQTCIGPYPYTVCPFPSCSLSANGTCDLGSIIPQTTIGIGWNQGLCGLSSASPTSIISGTSGSLTSVASANGACAYVPIC